MPKFNITAINSNEIPVEKLGILITSSTEDVTVKPKGIRIVQRTHLLATIEAPDSDTARNHISSILGDEFEISSEEIPES